MTAAPLLLELFTEEMPARVVETLSATLARELSAQLLRAGLIDEQHAGLASDADSGGVKVFATPRRLGVLWAQVRARQQDREVERKGPAVASAFGPDGKPTAALDGFLRAANATVEHITRKQEGRHEYVVVRQAQLGETLAHLFPGFLQVAIKKLPIAKAMAWGDRSETFIRPVRGLTLLHGDQVIAANLFGIASDRIIHGHRTLCPEPLELATAMDYAPRLLSPGHVIANHAVRRTQIRRALDEHAGNLRWIGGDALVDEVAALVEWPVVLRGSFDAKYLAVPRECLVLTMQKNQKYFPLEDHQGCLQAQFLVVANVPDGAKQSIRRGNERVLAARLSDAQFFFTQDRQHTLASRLSRLQSMAFYKGLGSQHERMERLVKLGTFLAQSASLSPQKQAQVQQACRLCKADLVSGMVVEFPELQGIMGRHYALIENQPQEVAWAIEDHYLPRFAGDELPRSDVGSCVALADKLDMLVGFFGVGQRPTADKDPFALRRAAAGAVRLLRRWPQSISLVELISSARQNYPAGVLSMEGDEILRSFMEDRLRPLLREEGYPAEHIEAVLAVGAPWNQLTARLQALAEFLAQPAASALVTTCKRVHNILRKVDSTQKIQWRPELLREPAEQALYQALKGQSAIFEESLHRQDYGRAFSQLAQLQPQVDRFFTDILVMAPEPDLRANRLALLQQVRQPMGRIADFSHLNIDGRSP